MPAECSLHHVPLESAPMEPRSRCPNCHYMTHHLRFDHCPECGTRMQIQQPEPEWRCPLCAEAEQKRAREAVAR